MLIFCVGLALNTTKSVEERKIRANIPRGKPVSGIDTCPGKAVSTGRGLTRPLVQPLPAAWASCFLPVGPGRPSRVVPSIPSHNQRHSIRSLPAWWKLGMPVSFLINPPASPAATMQGGSRAVLSAGLSQDTERHLRASTTRPGRAALSPGLRRAGAPCCPAPAAPAGHVCEETAARAGSTAHEVAGAAVFPPWPQQCEDLNCAQKPSRESPPRPWLLINRPCLPGPGQEISLEPFLRLG